MDEMNLIGYYLTELEERTVVVLVDAAETEHVVETPEQLWVAIMGIASDPALPRCHTDDLPDGEEFEQQAAAAGGHLHSFVCEQAEGIVTDAAGPVFGRMAGAMIRNGGQDALRLLRFISRNEKKG